MENIKELLNDMKGGCSSITWSTDDGKHLWGRNFDFNRIAEGSKVTYIPKGKEYYCCGTSIEDNLLEESKVISVYGALGNGSLLIPSTPVLYEGINEKGLMGGQLYFRSFAKYKDKADKGTIPLQAPFVITYVLTHCANLEEVVDSIKNKVTIVSTPMLGVTPTIHWSFTDRSGETIIIELDEGGTNIYRNSMGILTNSPSYSWHRLNLLNYFDIRNLDYDLLEINGDKLEQCFSGNGAVGLPGDCSSPSRFIRLSFLKKYGIKGKSEEEGISNTIHLFNNVAFPLGLVEVSEKGDITKYDNGVVPYDYTVYTSVMCSESLKFYWVTYENQRVQCVDLNKLLSNTDYVQFDLNRKADFKYIN
ncbi:Penicillin acylase precursor [uncultured Clostridium sp.]|uniref:linear amide C-N hydrolase n=1 Tax=uncultured Clostridium sp. TaxID=59620 RepID=UPI0008211CC5|nr:linear amide C-N hydrolase [uncultured Clostridium sp.]SCJ93576.1 Penicillin acylase precursor [uncultured Clostridium sp.]